VKSIFAFLTLVLAFNQPVLAISEADLLPVEKAYPLSAKAISSNEIQINWQIVDGYYLYKHRFGVSAVDPSVKVGEMILPAGEKHHDEFFGDVETYRKKVSALVSIENPKQLNIVSLKVKYQGCADIGVCYPPQTKILDVALPAETANTPSGLDVLVQNNIIGKDVLGEDKQALPEEQAFKTDALRDGNSLVVRLTPAYGYYLYQAKIKVLADENSGISLGAMQLPKAEPYHDESFGDVQVYFNQIEVRIPWFSDNAPPSQVPITVHLQGCKNEGICYPPMQRELLVDFSNAQANPNNTEANLAPVTEQSATTWLVAIFLALLGGLILNLMPCVLPVLSFKAMALAQAATAGHSRRHALWYTAGVMSSFAALGLGVLALRGAGQALGWGFQLQQPIVVGFLALFIFAIGLMMSGLFHWGSGFTGMGQSLTEKSGPAGDFFTGVLAVVVASPCTAPFMGGALAYAFSAHWILALLVFLALGLGLAAPFLLIGFMPNIAARLPKPGEWMNTLKHVLAYPMYFTAAWLAWVFGNQKGVNGLGLLLITAITLALALWWFERQKNQPSIGKKITVLAIALLAGLSFAFAMQQATPNASTVSSDKNYEAFSTARLNELRASGTPVFVDMTADWCITCKVNEKAVLHTDAFTQLLKETGTVYLVGDWTNQDPEITAFLNQYKTPGVPLYVVYPRGKGEGKKLPQLLTMGIMREALQTAP
jgi:thiol:disulfide interchange protein